MRYVLGLLALVSVAVAGPITTGEASCFQLRLADNGVVRESRGEHRCDAGNVSRANISSGWDIDGNLTAGWVNIEVYGGWDGDRGEYGAVNASAVLTNTIGTVGQRRQGVVRYSIPSAGSASILSSVPLVYYPGTSFGETPITLGASLAFTLTASTAVDGYFGYGGMSQGAAFMILEFFEADRVTPVEVYSTPEPSTWGMVAVGILAVMKTVRHRRS